MNVGYTYQKFFEALNVLTRDDSDGHRVADAIDLLAEARRRAQIGFQDPAIDARFQLLLGRTLGTGESASAIVSLAVEAVRAQVEHEGATLNDSARNRSLSVRGVLRELSEAKGMNTLFHGGVLRTPGPFGDDGRAEETASWLTTSIERGLKALELGSSEFAPDAEAVPGAPVQVIDLFDIETGDDVLIWRVACRERSKQAN